MLLLGEISDLKLPTQPPHNRLDIKHAAAPGAAADRLQRRPQPRIGGELRIGRQVVARRPTLQHALALLGAESFVALADQIDVALQAVAVDYDLNAVAVANLAD